MYPELYSTIQHVEKNLLITDAAKSRLQTLIDYVQQQVNHQQQIDLHFICTHNSRRSQLAQIWAQTAAAYYRIQNVCCYSGGTETTALYAKVIAILRKQGFQVYKITDGNNPVYAVKYNANALPVIGFSKTYDNPFNPSSAFAAVMTCSQADSGCPFIAGAEKRIPLPYDDPKLADSSDQQDEVYEECSLKIASDILYVFSKITPHP
ncbi:arsenate-mycothiol transferase ArsC [Sphingobacterium spiritivorum]|nr:protein-tyrosine-phosphatase [Sphingobacterium spiritivorum]QQS96799.1 protein-tyrosine-phosphatase [Sphingobacterium spiritivorum]